jgi:hypothetical protein
VGDLITIAGSNSNDGDYVVRTVVSALIIEVDIQHALVAEGPVAATATVFRPFIRSINSIEYPYHWRVFGNNAGADEIFQFIQRELRRTTDIDEGPAFSRGDITDLLMTFASPTGLGLDMFIDDLDPNDKNNVTFTDSSGVTRAFSFVSAGTIAFNVHLQGDANAVYAMFFDTTPQGNYGTPQAITVQDSNSQDIAGNVGGAPSVGFDFDYDNNSQGGRTPATNADIILVAIGLDTAQFVLFEGTITRATGLTFSLVSALERNYSNP